MPAIRVRSCGASVHASESINQSTRGFIALRLTAGSASPQHAPQEGRSASVVRRSTATHITPPPSLDPSTRLQARDKGTMAAAPGQQKSASKMLYMLPLMFMANKVRPTLEMEPGVWGMGLQGTHHAAAGLDSRRLPVPPTTPQINYTDEFVNFLRLTYYTVQLGTLILAYIVIRNKVRPPSSRDVDHTPTHVCVSLPPHVDDSIPSPPLKTHPDPPTDPAEERQDQDLPAAHRQPLRGSRGGPGPAQGVHLPGARARPGGAAGALHAHRHRHGLLPPLEDGHQARAGTCVCVGEGAKPIRRLSVSSCLSIVVFHGTHSTPTTPQTPAHTPHS